MKTCTLLIAVFTLLTLCHLAQGVVPVPAVVQIGAMFPFRGLMGKGSFYDPWVTAMRWTIDNINSNSSFLHGTKLNLTVGDDAGSQQLGLKALLDQHENPGIHVMIGAGRSSTCQTVSIGAAVYNIPCISYACTAIALSDKLTYPFFNRVVPPDPDQASAMVALVAFYKWTEIAILSSTDDYGVSGANQVILQGSKRNIDTLAYQQMQRNQTDVSLQIEELKKSKARIFINWIYSLDFPVVLEEADKQNIIGPTYVWFCSDACAQNNVFTNSTGYVDVKIRKLMTGIIGFGTATGVGAVYNQFLQDYSKANKTLYPTAGQPLQLYGSDAVDAITAIALSVRFIQDNKVDFNGTNLQTVLRNNITFTGLTGKIDFDSLGDRSTPIYEIRNFQKYSNTTVNFVLVGIWSTDGFIFTNYSKIVWEDGTTNVPDLDVRDPIKYWSCWDGEEGEDKTGKKIKLEKPDEDDANYIDIDYRCDEWIDCQNMSDEDYGCTPSIVIAFIVIGIITGFLILGACGFIVFTCVFGCCFKRRRLRKLSPPFLILMCVAAIVGYGATYAWYGKPQLVACNFQSWLLAPAVNLLISALFAKTFRIWQIFKNPFKKTRIPDWQLMILVTVLMIPCIIILIIWTAISTPTASMEKHDGMEHYVCNTGGVTGEPGGLVFFFIMVAYIGLVLLFGVFLAFVTRNVPAEYSEAKLVGYSCYNLTFLGAVIIPVFLVLRNISPFAAWLVRTLGILYGFTATLWLQFFPPMFVILIRNCGREPPAKMKELSDISQSASNSSSRASMSMSPLNSTSVSPRG